MFLRIGSLRILTNILQSLQKTSKSLKGQSHKIFCIWFVLTIKSSWSHKRWPRAVLIFSYFSRSYWTFKMTPQCLGHWGVDPKFLGWENFAYMIKNLFSLFYYYTVFLMSVASKAVACAWRFKQTENNWKRLRCPIHRGVANLTRWKSINVLSTGELFYCSCEPSSPCYSL